MSHHLAVCGIATADGLFARCGDGWRKLQPTREPIAAQASDELIPCSWCGETVCDCQDWLEWMLRTTPQEDGDDEQA